MAHGRHLVEGMAAHSHSHAEKRLLRELHRYLKGVMTMRDVESNLVYVVSLGTDPVLDDGTSFADVVIKHNSYFHPVGGGPRRMAEHAAELHGLPL